MMIGGGGNLEAATDGGVFVGGEESFVNTTNLASGMPADTAASNDKSQPSSREHESEVGKDRESESDREHESGAIEGGRSDGKRS